MAFFGHTAVLTGRVSSLVTKQHIAECLEEENAVDRIVDKVKVMHPPRSANNPFGCLDVEIAR